MKSKYPFNPATINEIQIFIQPSHSATRSTPPTVRPWKLWCINAHNGASTSHKAHKALINAFNIASQVRQSPQCITLLICGSDHGRGSLWDERKRELKGLMQRERERERESIKCKATVTMYICSFVYKLSTFLYFANFCNHWCGCSYIKKVQLHCSGAHIYCAYA